MKKNVGSIVKKKAKSDENIDKVFVELDENSSASKLLLENLKGNLLFKFNDVDNAYLIKFNAEDLTVVNLAKNTGSDEGSDINEDIEVDTTISINKGDFDLILSGKLNPQIAMLSHKIVVEGNMHIAMYFFNLFS